MVLPLNVVTLTAALLLVGVCYKLYTKLFAGKYPLPPGPKAQFLVGHYGIVPAEGPQFQYAKWSKELNTDILYFESFGTKWIVLNSLQASIDLLDKRGNNYSDRPRFIMNDLMGWAPTLTWLRWSPKMQQHRKLLQPPFSKSKVSQYCPLQRREAIKAAQSILRTNADPMAWNNAIRRFAVAVVINIGFGVEIKDDKSPYIKIADEAAMAISNAGAPASSIVDRFPATRFLPSFLPFMERKRYAERWRYAIENITNIPFAATIADLAANRRTNCFAADRLSIHASNAEKGIPNDFSLADIKGAAAAIYIAGNDTTQTTIALFVLYLMQHPAVRAKAVAEIDRVVGSERLPEFADIPNLPYLNLVLQECYRMNPLSPLGIPHASVKDDVYRGMRIPAGTIVYQNVWAITHDPAVYSRAFEFWPERYLSVEEGGKGEPFPVGNFGFGRRVCIGRNLAENSMFMMFAVVLATVEFGWPLGPDGGEEEYEIEWSFKGQAHPLPFKCRMAPRSAKAEALLMNADLST
ncbi:putative O-methylsterigmatocystin oxidoreductase [Lophium mytilinum]|uniref:Putative O-methylsterigmatocystin oxidoreductase n=1 Tax=Lophium mytilinum TaxID=390894 RepID=A0A6A6QGW4_9PEZI|nr:putative O-methylsterigmatocystin oxidoreductase [Lophium mytilinum]